MTRGHIFFLYIAFNIEKEITDGKAYKPSAIYAWSPRWLMWSGRGRIQGTYKYSNYNKEKETTNG